MTASLLFAFAGCSSAEPSRPAPPPRIAIRDRGFLIAGTATPFSPLGFNYDHDESDRLIEDYWRGEWGRVEHDFAEMRDLGATVVRVHLQFGKFMEAPNRANEDALARYGMLLDLADRTGLRLDVTGLACYRPTDVPAWYDALDEAARWDSQAAFWTAVASRSRGRGAVFCYDLMNEPVVPGVGDTRPGWLTEPFGGPGGFCFVQFVTRSTGTRPRAEVARAWIRRLAGVVRAADPGALVTCGFTDWSIDKPGLSTGFTPALAAPELDFLCVHVYPSSKKFADGLAVLETFAGPGKPVVVEETFALHCSAEEWLAFTKQAAPNVAGWMGFYWGRTARECRDSGSIRDAIMAAWLEAFERMARTAK